MKTLRFGVNVLYHSLIRGHIVVVSCHRKLDTVLFCCKMTLWLPWLLKLRVCPAAGAEKA